MNWRRVGALILRYTFLYTRSMPRILEMFFWPVMDLLVWGFVTMYLLKAGIAEEELVNSDRADEARAYAGRAPAEKLYGLFETLSSAVRDLDAANARDVKARVKGEPFLTQIDFAIGVKIHRCAWINAADIRQMPGDIAGGQIKGAAQGYGGVRKIAAHTIATSDDLRCR